MLPPKFQPFNRKIPCDASFKGPDTPLRAMEAKTMLTRFGDAMQVAASARGAIEVISHAANSFHAEGAFGFLSFATLMNFDSPVNFRMVL